jgi:Sulfotransferase domain
MALRVIGAGLGRTGTHSLKVALEQLLGGPCYHMLEVMAHPDHIASWRAATQGGFKDWDRLLAGFQAAVDWPSAAFWPELCQAYPDAVVLLSTRRDAEAWWKSANETIFVGLRDSAARQQPILQMASELLAARFCSDLGNKQAAITAYERHNAAVRAAVPKAKLIDWQPDQGWGPICAGLRIPVPVTPFPHVNTTEEFQAKFAARMARARGDG